MVCWWKLRSRLSLKETQAKHHSSILSKHLPWKNREWRVRLLKNLMAVPLPKCLKDMSPKDSYSRNKTQAKNYFVAIRSSTIKRFNPTNLSKPAIEMQFFWDWKSLLEIRGLRGSRMTLRNRGLRMVLMMVVQMSLHSSRLGESDQVRRRILFVRRGRGELVQTRKF